MVVIRLSRAGAKKRPFYHMVVTDSRKRRDGGYIERIGYFNPVARGQEFRLHLEMDKLTHWQNIGAQLSDRVSALVKEFKKKAAANNVDNSTDWVVVGRFGRAHGIKGFITVHSFTEPRDNILRYTDWHVYINKQWQPLKYCI